MVQNLSSFAGASCDRILCYYENVTSQMQLARIVTMPGRSYERVVFPKQRLLFEATASDDLEVHTCTANTTLLARIPCLTLQVKETASNFKAAG